MRSKTARWLTFIFSVFLLLWILFLGWIFAWYRYPLRLFKEKEHLQLESVTYIEILFSEQMSPHYVTISNEDAIAEILDYLNTLTLIQEEETEDEKAYNPYDLYDKYFYLWIDNETFSFGEKYMFHGHANECDCVGTNYYFYDSSVPFFPHGEAAYDFFQDLLKKYENADGIRVS